MHVWIVLLIAIAMPFSIWSAINALAMIAEYRGNPVIELVEELRKKYSNTNEN
nr:MAG TPA: hypothetical protein [Caudoviricetes sp.]